ncbi:putative late blight resistance protein R1A-10 [Salvia divinorum]|uniref:Late blight resistance protein R1A-10 n=1 Tax=Salvia divinorum TaxID=28513 RepID=A0ABD1GZ26_SALDI
MAYAAVISLKNTLDRLLHSSHLNLNTRKLIKHAYKQTISLQQLLSTLDDCSSRNLNAVDQQITHETHKLENLLEFHDSNPFLDHKPNNRKETSGSWQNSEEISQGIQSFCETVDKITEDSVAEIPHFSPEQDHDSDDQSYVKKGTVSVDYGEARDRLTERTRPNDFGIFQITGELGCGTTIAAAAILEDLKRCFDCAAGVRVGPVHERREILVCILAQINEPCESLDGKGEVEMGEFLYESLKGRRYLIVMDDVRDVGIWNFLESSFPVEDNGSAVLFTTRRQEKKLLRIRNRYMSYNMACRDQDTWWYMFRAGLFGPEECHAELEEAGKMILHNCRSLAIVILKVLLHLLKAEKTAQYWNQLAADQQNPIFIVDDEISEMCKIQEDLSSVSYSFLDEEEKGLLLEFIDFSNHIENIKKEILPQMFFPKMLTISFLGMAGIGKTTLAKEIFEDPMIRRCYDHHLWLTLGPEYVFEEILVDLLSQICPDIDKDGIKQDEDLVKRLCEQILDKKCLTVLDDVWSKKPLDYMKKLFPNIKGVALVTTRLAKVAQIGVDDPVCKMQLLNEEESWDLFCEEVFGETICPIRLEKAGKKIVENCEGLPLMIVTVASLLSRVEKTAALWNDAAQKNSQIFMDAYDQISTILVSSYKHLPQYLKVCFLYIGIFPQNKAIPTSQLILFWIAEGFLEPNSGNTIQDYAAECLLELESRCLVMVGQQSSSFKIKAFSLHSVFWHLSNNLATQSNFFRAFSTLADCGVENMEIMQRRLCIRNSTLLGIKDVHHSIASFSTTRSLICASPSHQYPVPVCFGLRLLRLMDALAIRLYEFPTEVVDSYFLRYLALTYNGSIPPCISKLWNLQFLIVSRHLSLVSSADSSYLPMEIWDMEELKHLQVAGSNLPDPDGGVALRHLSTLVGVSARSCTKKVLRKVSGLKRLGIRIELEPDENDDPYRCLNRISRLRRLESLKCVVVNPDFMPERVPPPAPRSMFPWGLKKLSLSGLGYPWEYMKIISKLENLQVLKLRCYAFQGPDWELRDDDLHALRFLLIEDTDLVRWKFSAACFIHLKCLCIKHCYQLEEIPPELCTSVETIQVVDCNPMVQNWAKDLEMRAYDIISSWDATKF